jgi:hypothetical protein
MLGPKYKDSVLNRLKRRVRATVRAAAAIHGQDGGLAIMSRKVNGHWKLLSDEKRGLLQNS